MIDPLGFPSTLGAACEINPARPDLSDVPDDQLVMFIPMAAVDEVSGSVLAAEPRRLEELRRKSYRTFASGDVIFAKITPCMENGKAAVVPDMPFGVGFGSTEFHVLRPREGVSPHFIWHFVRQDRFRRVAEKYMTGSVGQARVPAGFLEEFPILLPDLEAQLKIVRTLDAATSSERSARLHLENARTLSARMRDSILIAACRGHLTAGIGGDDTKVVGAPTGWEEASVGDLCSRVSVGHVGPTSKHYVSEGGVPFVRSQNVRPARLVLEGCQFISHEFHARLKKSQLIPGDVLVVRVGANRGDCCMVPRDLDSDLNCANIVFARPESIEPEYLALFLQGPGRRLLLHQTTGSAQGVINTKAIARIRVAVPPRWEQTAIVRQVERIMQRTREFETRITGSLHSISRASRISGESLLMKSPR